MNDPLKEQLSAFLDGALPGEESELLLRRLCAETELSEHAGRYWLIGEALRESGRPATCGPSRRFAARVCAAIAIEAPVSALEPEASAAPSAMRSGPMQKGQGSRGAAVPAAVRPQGRWLRRTVGLALAASVSAVAVLIWQASQGLLSQGPLPMTVHTAALGTPGTASAVAAANAPHDSPVGVSEAVPIDREGTAVPADDAGAARMRGPRLADYVMAHSEYSSPLGRRAMLSGILAEDGDSQGVQDVRYVEPVR